jgi:hypothetical protein
MIRQAAVDPPSLGSSYRVDGHPGHPTPTKDITMIPKNTICLWFDGTALDAANFYAATFPDSEVRAVHRAPGDYPSGKEGDVLTVDFTVLGIPCIGLNGGDTFRHSEAFSFQIATDDQARPRGGQARVRGDDDDAQDRRRRDRSGRARLTSRQRVPMAASMHPQRGPRARRCFHRMNIDAARPCHPAFAMTADTCRVPGRLLGCARPQPPWIAPCNTGISTPPPATASAR